MIPSIIVGSFADCCLDVFTVLLDVMADELKTSVVLRRLVQKHARKTQAPTDVTHVKK
jgi:hypothetical protein